MTWTSSVRERTSSWYCYKTILQLWKGDRKNWQLPRGNSLNRQFLYWPPKSETKRCSLCLMLEFHLHTRFPHKSQGASEFETVVSADKSHPVKSEHSTGRIRSPSFKPRPCKETKAILRALARRSCGQWRRSFMFSLALKMRSKPKSFQDQGLHACTGIEEMHTLLRWKPSSAA